MEYWVEQACQSIRGKQRGVARIQLLPLLKPPVKPSSKRPQHATSKPPQQDKDISANIYKQQAETEKVVHEKYKHVLKVNAQQVARKNAEAWRSFFSLIKEKREGLFCS